jgi:hypothetical protein
MAICLPGKASRVKRAETSETRPAPLVTTTRLMITRIMNTNSPTAKLPPIRKAPKASITWPAAAPPSCPRTSTMRVEATLSARRSRVANSRTEKCAEIERLFRVHRRHQDRHRQGDVEDEEHVEQHRGQGHDHQHDEREDAGGQGHGTGRTAKGASFLNITVYSPMALSRP